MKANKGIMNPQSLYLFLVALLSFSLFLLIGLIDTKNNFLAALNNTVYTNLQTLRSPSLDAFLIIIGFMGGGIFINLNCILVSILLILKRRFFAIIHLYAGLGIARGIINYFKNTFEMVRPSLAKESSFSYPSSHATIAFTFFIFLSWLFANSHTSYKRILLFIAVCIPAVLVGFSRIYLGEHWLVDVCGGALLATAINCLTISIYRLYEHRPIIINKCEGLVIVIIGILILYLKRH